MEPPTAALAPNDAMRNGVATVKGELMTVHPVQPIQASMAKDEVQRQRGVLAATYGQHVPLRMQIESEILSQFRRLPTLQSSMLGLETLAGRDTQINVADVFGASCGDHRQRVLLRCVGFILWDQLPLLHMIPVFRCVLRVFRVA